MMVEEGGESPDVGVGDQQNEDPFHGNVTIHAAEPTLDLFAGVNQPVEPEEKNDLLADALSSSKDAPSSPRDDLFTEVSIEHTPSSTEASSAATADAKAGVGGVRTKENMNEYIRSLCGMEGLALLKENALRGSLHNTDMRGISWRIFLGVLSPDPTAWEKEIRDHRLEFERLRDKHFVDPHTVAADKELDKFNPLSQHEENPWNQYFQNNEIQREINHDVWRTYPGIPFFDKQTTKDTMTKLLFMYAKEHTSTRYIQGMNELLAPILYVLNAEKQEVNENSSPFDIVRDEKYFEHDAFTLFSHLLTIVGRWFSPLKSANSSGGSNSNNNSSADATKKALLDDHLYMTSAQADESTNLQIVQQCRHIHYTLLNEVDPHLARYLKDLQIEPHLYMLRWVRIMLTQVFPLNNVMILWDGIFAFGNSTALLDWLCVSMLVSIRHLLLGQDYSHCMSRLFNYPQDQDVCVLVSTAQQLFVKYHAQRHNAIPKPSLEPTIQTVATNKQRQPKQPTSPRSTAASSASTSVSASAASPKHQPSAATNTDAQTHHTTQAHHNATSTAFPPGLVAMEPRQPAPSQNSKLMKELQQENHVLRNTVSHLAARLDRVLYILGSLPSSPESDDTVASAIEEISQIKCVLAEASKPKADPLLLLSDPKLATNGQSPKLPPPSPSPASATATQAPSNSPQAGAPQQTNYYEKILSLNPFGVFRTGSK